MDITVARLIRQVCTPPPTKQEILVAKAKMFDEMKDLLNDILEWDGILDHSKVRIKATVDKAKAIL